MLLLHFGGDPDILWPMSDNERLIPCIGCGALVPDIEGPNFRYPDASVPGCWKAFEELLAREFGEYRYPPVHRLSVDAYAVQHPGRETRQTIQSVNVHLIALCISIERKYPYDKVTELMRGAVHVFEEDFCWLDPPKKRGKLTVLDVIRAEDLREHVERVQLWALSVWGAWSPHHAAVRSYCDRLEQKRSRP